LTVDRGTASVATMTVGEINAYMAGLQAGYWARVGEENERWQMAATAERVFIAGDWVDTPTAAERKAVRVAVLREGHTAGLHAGRRPVADCPECAA
jgi:hypothetical protein